MELRNFRPLAGIPRTLESPTVPTTPSNAVDRGLLIQLALLLGSGGALAYYVGWPGLVAHLTLLAAYQSTTPFGWFGDVTWGIWFLTAIGLAWHGVSLLTARVPAVARSLESLAVVVLLAFLAIVLDRGGGPPHLPSHVPSWLELQLALQSPDVFPPWASDLLGLLGWAFWLWVAATLLVQLALAVAEAFTHGARWVLTVRHFADRVTLPIVRRAAHQAVVVVTVLQLVSRVTPAAAAPAPSTAAVLMTGRPLAAAALTASALTAQHVQTQTTTVTVRPGDSLWTLAERCYGDGEQWPKIFAANVGRPMVDGATFPQTGVIQSGWILRIPETRASQPSAPVQQAVYTVQQDDTLRIIARRSYGDELAWPRIFDANRGAHLPDGRTLSDPNMIWPGLRLVIPGIAPVINAAPTSVTHPAPVAPLVALAPAPPTAPAHVAPKPAQPSSTGAVVATPPSSPSQVDPPVTEPAAPVLALSPIATAAPVSVPAVPATAIAPESHAPPPHLAAQPSLPPPLFAPGAAALAAALAGAGVVLLARRRYRTSLTEPPVPPDADAGVMIRDGYADAAHAPTFAGGLDGGTEPALLVTEQVLAWLTEEGLLDVAVLTVGEGRHSMQMTLQAGLAAQERLLALAPDLAERLGGQGDAVRTTDHDLLLRLRNLTLLRLAARPRPGPIPALPLVALGVLPDGAMLHANWRLLGHVLICGLPGSGSEILLSSLLTALAARCHPETLRLWIIAPRAAFPPPLFDLPHGCDGGVEPDDAHGVAATVAAVRAELERRMHAGAWQGPTVEQPELVLVLSELTGLSDDGLFAVLGRHGPSYGIRLLAATTRAESLPETLLESFVTRLVLCTSDETQSRRLLGRTDAADLAGGGDLWARIADRAPVRLCGVRLEPDFLDRLVDRMHAAYSEVAPAPPSPDATPCRNTGEGTSFVPCPPVVFGSMAPLEPADLAPVPAAEAEDGTASSLTSASMVTESPAAREQEADGGDAEAIPPLPQQAKGGNGVVYHDGAIVLIPPVTSEPVGAVVPTPPAVAAAGLMPDTGSTRIQVYCFGDLRVASGDRDLSSRGQQMPWELLIFLALHEPGTVAKEDLLATLWPGTDPADAGPRIRMAMQRLRKVLADQVPELPSEVVRIEREGICRLDSTLVWLDAQQFLAWYEAARRSSCSEQRTAALEAARQLAQDGLFSQIGFRWLDQRRRGRSIRQRYRELDTWVTSELAHCYLEKGQPERAIPLYRELLAAEPTLQEVARELYLCYGALGDRAALVEEHQQLTEALDWRRRQAKQAGHAQLGCRLEATTVATYDEALSRLDAAAAAVTGD